MHGPFVLGGSFGVSAPGGSPSSNARFSGGRGWCYAVGMEAYRQTERLISAVKYVFGALAAIFVAVCGIGLLLVRHFGW
jgi:hypothetical protein